MWNDIANLLSKYWENYLNGTLATIVLSFVGTFGGLFLGIFLAYFKSLKAKNVSIYQKLWRIPLKFLSNLYSIIIRGTPMMVQAMLFKYGSQMLGVNWNNVLMGINTWNGWFLAGLIVITFNTTAYMGEIIESGLNGVGNDQIEGAKSLGMNDFQILIHVTLPQAIRNSIPTIGNEWVVNIKDSSVLNVIAVSELYWQASSAASKGYQYLATYVIIACIYLSLTLISTGILKLIAFKLDGNKISTSLKNYLSHYKKVGAN